MLARRRRIGAAVLSVSLLAAALMACGSSSDVEDKASEIRLGYFPNLTHATALVGVEKGFFTDALGDVTLSTQTFNAGPAAVEALFGGGLDATYIGPNPAINAFVKSDGEAIRIISGATSKGAQFVVQPDISSADDLLGKTVSSPQLGNTQDVALRSWLKKEGIATDVNGGGDVSIVPQENATILQQFQDGAIAGAWVPEPWASRLVLQGGGKVLVDEIDEFPRGEFVTTQLIVRTDFLNANPDIVEALLRGHVTTNDWIAENNEAAEKLANDELGELSGKPLPNDVLNRAWGNITTTNDPIATSLKTDADNAADVGVTKQADLTGIYDLSLLNKVLTDNGTKPVSAAGLGKE